VTSFQVHQEFCNKIHFEEICLAQRYGQFLMAIYEE
jgi:hypothetical protein